MSDSVDRVRAHIYRTFADTGWPPEMPAIAAALGEPARAVREAIDTLVSRHAIILTPDGTAIERALPFSAVPTAFRVVAGPHAWWANCVWDALGIPPLVGASGLVHTTCADCDRAVTLAVDPVEGPDRTDLTAHFLLPASRWYDDIRFT